VKFHGEIRRYPIQFHGEIDLGDGHMDQPITIALVNRKGGCAKTSTCFHLSGVFGKEGRRCLLIDMDPQASLTQGLIGPQATESLTKGETVAALFDDAFDPDPDSLIVPTAFDRVWLIPGSDVLDDHNVPRPQEAGDVQLALKTFLSEVSGDFDIVLIDCPPNLHLCSWSALLAANCVVVPFQAEDYGSQGITHIQRAFDKALALNPSLRLLGYLVTMFDKRLGIQQTYDRLLRQMYGDHVFQETVPLSKDFKEAVAARQPVNYYKPRGAATKAMKAVASELLNRAAAAGQRPSEYLSPENRVLLQHPATMDQDGLSSAVA
jgi:chromosome partitioning protein